MIEAYTISWGYICQEMKKKGYSSKSNEQESFNTFQILINQIWSDYIYDINKYNIIGPHTPEKKKELFGNYPPDEEEECRVSTTKDFSWTTS